MKSNIARPPEPSVTEADRLHFSRVAADLLAPRPPRGSEDAAPRAGIGTYKEKTLHSVLKYFICDDAGRHEIKIFPDTPDESGARESKYIADVLIDCDIYEIQTGGLYPLRDKIKFYLEQTSYNVSVVCPLAARKWISWIDPATSEIGKRSPSPKKQTGLDILPELLWLLPHLNNRRFSVRVLLLSVEEFRLKNGWGNGGKRGSERCDRIPTDLLGSLNLCLPSDYINLLPPSLPNTFTAKDFSALTPLKGKKTYAALKVLLELGLITPAGKSNRAARYMKTY